MAWIFGLTISILVQFLCFTSPSSADTCTVADEKRLDCGWLGINQAHCEARGCCWRAASAIGFPWCFYDSATVKVLKTKKACEHQSSVVLQCNETEKVSIHDVFYGRNSGDTSCHNSGSTTCFHPNATEIVKNICKDNSTCSVSPKGSFWHFDATCDGLNAQLIVHYTCVSRASSSSISVTSYSTNTAAMNSTSWTLETSTIKSTEAASSSSSVISTYITSTSAMYSTPSTLPVSSTSKEVSSSTLIVQKSVSNSPATVASTTEPAVSTEVVATTELSISQATATKATIKASPSITTTSTSMPITSSSTTEPLSSYTTTITTSYLMETPTSAYSTTTAESLAMVVSFLPTSSSLVYEALSTTSIPNQTFSRSQTSLAPSISKTVSSISSSLTPKLESSSFSTQSSSMQPMFSHRRSASSTETVSKSTRRSQSASSSQASASATIRPTMSISPASTSSAVPSSVPPTNPAGPSDKSKGKLSKTTYVLIGVGALVLLVLLIVLTVCCVRKKLSPRHEIMTDDLPIAPQGTYYSVPMNEVTSYDNPVTQNDENGPQIFNNEVYSLKPTPS